MIESKPSDLDPLVETSREAGIDERIDDTPPRHTPLWALLSGWLLSVEAWLRSHGDKPLRMVIRGFWVVVGSVGVILLVGPVIYQPLTLEDILSSTSTATETWIARDFAVDYTVSLDDDGSLVAEVEERITAFFPADVDQSSITRVLATDYEGHDLRPSAISATLDGASIDVERTDEPARSTLLIDAGERLQGDHDVMFRYTLHDVAYDTDDRATGAPIQLLEWDVFGPGWSQGLAGITVRLSLADELNDELIRQPRGVVAWTIVSAGGWLDPEETSPAGFTTYEISNDQNLPPYANAIFTVVLPPDTITMPSPSTLFWVQTFAPIVPLLVLLATLLLAVAARRVAWSDERGAPWYVEQSEPPEGVSPRLAAHILKSRRAVELADALQAIPMRKNGDLPRAFVHKVALVAHRTGRIGDLPRALIQYWSGSENALQHSQKLRSIPVGFVRDAFIAAPVAITLVQWGIVRQLSYQAPIAEVWWPTAFVTLSSICAIVVIAIATSARPLTKKGALLKQQLLGIGVFSERTNLVERGVLTEPVLAYAVLSAPAREAGEALAERAEVELGESIPEKSWRGGDFLTVPRLLIRALALTLIIGVIALVNIVPNPYERAPDPLAYSDDIPGSLWAQVTSFTAIGELSRDASGRAVIKVSETMDVSFAEGSSLPPQLVRQWPTRVDGQELRVSIQNVTVSGEDAPFVHEQSGTDLVMRTTYSTPVSGDQEVRIDYTISSAAVAAESAEDGSIIDRVRWAALLDGWNFQYGDEANVVDPLHVELRLSEDLEAEAIHAGWITVDRHDDVRLGQSPDGIIAFGTVEPVSDTDATRESTQRSSDSVVHLLELGVNEYDRYPFDFTLRDVGTMIDFPAGTFAGPDEETLRAAQFRFIWPVAVTVMMGLLGLLLAGATCVNVVSRGMSPVRSGVLRDVMRWLVPALTFATCVMFGWVSMNIPADDPPVAPTGFAALASLVAVSIALWLGWRKGERVTANTS
ncbi:MAG: DUF2207 domain-containing protein [Microbacteriaceae bacterium]